MRTLLILALCLTGVAASAAPAPDVIVYYFHGTRRCATCRKLESYTREALETHFAKELAAGTIALQAVNTDDRANANYIKQYQLVSKAVVLSRQTKGTETSWKNLDQIWLKVKDKEDYIGYIRDELNALQAATKSPSSVTNTPATATAP